LLSFSGTLYRTEGTTVGTVTASPKFPFNIAKTVELKDYSGITRISTSGYLAYLLELVKNRNVDLRVPYDDPDDTIGYQSTIYAASVPAGTASTTTSAPLAFTLVVPISLTKNTALGSFPAAVPNGESQLIVSENTLVGNTIDYPFTVSGGSVLSIVGQWYITTYYQDAAQSVPVPVAALTQIHEVYEQRSTTDLTAGQEHQHVLQTGRTYYRVLQLLVNNNALDTTDVTQVKFLVDSSTPTLDEYLFAYLMRQRIDLGRDLPAGTFYWNFSRSPWSPNNYGSLTLTLTLSSGFTAASPYLDTLRETLYIPTGNLITTGATS
jgi:hypothetical protein